MTGWFETMVTRLVDRISSTGMMMVSYMVLMVLLQLHDTVVDDDSHLV